MRRRVLDRHGFVGDPDTLLLLHLDSGVMESRLDSSGYHNQYKDSNMGGIWFLSGVDGSWGTCLDDQCWISFDGSAFEAAFDNRVWTADWRMYIPDIMERTNVFKLGDLLFTWTGFTSYPMRCSASLGAAYLNMEIGWQPGTGWHHFALVCDGMSIRHYVDGVDKGEMLPFPGTSSFHGDLVVGDPGSYWYIDEFRLSRVARWASDFIPPEGPYE